MNKMIENLLDGEFISMLDSVEYEHLNECDIESYTSFVEAVNNQNFIKMQPWLAELTLCSYCDGIAKRLKISTKGGDINLIRFKPSVYSVQSVIIRGRVISPAFFFTDRKRVKRGPYRSKEAAERAANWSERQFIANAIKEEIASTIKAEMKKGRYVKRKTEVETDEPKERPLRKIDFI